MKEKDKVMVKYSTLRETLLSKDGSRMGSIKGIRGYLARRNNSNWNSSLFRNRV